MNLKHALNSLIVAYEKVRESSERDPRPQLCLVYSKGEFRVIAQVWVEANEVIVAQPEQLDSPDGDNLWADYSDAELAQLAESHLDQYLDIYDQNQENS